MEKTLTVYYEDTMDKQGVPIVKVLFTDLGIKGFLNQYSFIKKAIAQQYQPVAGSAAIFLLGDHIVFLFGLENWDEAMLFLCPFDITKEQISKVAQLDVYYDRVKILVEKAKKDPNYNLSSIHFIHRPPNVGIN